MRCYICDRETTDFHREPDGRWISLCPKCKSNQQRYRDVNEEECDMKLLKMNPIDLIKEIDNECRATDSQTASVSK